MSTNQQTGIETEVASLIQSTRTWLVEMLEDDGDPINRALSDQDKAFLRRAVSGSLWYTIRDTINQIIDDDKILSVLSDRLSRFTALMDQSPTIETIVNKLFNFLDELLQSGISALEKLARFCIDLLFNITEILIKLSSQFEVSTLLPDWLAQRITGGESVNAISLFLALPVSSVKKLLNGNT